MKNARACLWRFCLEWMIALSQKLPSIFLKRTINYATGMLSGLLARSLTVRESGYFDLSSNMRFEKILFDHGQRHFELIEALGCFRQLTNFACDEEALRSHLAGEGRPRRCGEDGTLVGVSDQEVEKFVSPIADSIETALDAYRRQLIVVIVSIVEAAISDAFSVLFYFQPETMKGLSKDAANPSFSLTVSIDELMESNQIDDLRMAIVERAVSFACQGKNKQTVLRRMERLFSQKFEKKIESEFIYLIEKRNRIVHDTSREDVSAADVEDFFDIGVNFVRELGRFVSNRSLPVNDPMHIYGG